MMENLKVLVKYSHKVVSKEYEFLDYLFSSAITDYSNNVRSFDNGSGVSLYENPKPTYSTHSVLLSLLNMNLRFATSALRSGENSS